MTLRFSTPALGVCACCVLLAGSAAFAQERPVIRMVKHSGWSELAPKGVNGDGIRRNLAVGDSAEFQDLTFSVTEMTPADLDESGSAVAGSVDRVTVSLAMGEESDTRTLDEGDAYNWQGYHISIVAIYAKKGDLGFGSTVFEVATVASLPEEVAQSESAGGAEFRLRVPHGIDKLTLHHSATPLTPEDDLGQKLANMQVWGENDRNWWDVPYHYILDLDGTVYEGRDHRFVGDTNTRYDPAGHFLINCYGNYSDQEPNEAQLETIANLMAWAAMEYSIEPVTIYGHRDLAGTSCPGDNLYEYVENGTLKEMVEAVMAVGQPEIVWVEKGE